MHAVIRTYSGQGAKELFDLLEKRKSEVESLVERLRTETAVLDTRRPEALRA